MYLHELITHSFDYNPFESKNIAIKPSLFIDLYKSSHKKILNLKNRERRKKISELYQTSLFALGLNSIVPKEYWVKIHDSEFPDSEIIFFGSMDEQRIQTYIYRIENLAPKDKGVTEEIKKKLVNKKYSICAEYPVLLLIYIDQDNTKFDNKSVLDMIKQQKDNPFGNIWSIHKLDDDMFEITQIFPMFRISTFSLSEMIKAINQQSHLLNMETRYFVRPSKKECKISLRVD
jgi:hypothetical protein